MNTIGVSEARKQFRGNIIRGQYVASWECGDRRIAAVTNSVADSEMCRLAAVLISVLHSDGLCEYPLDVQLVI